MEKNQTLMLSTPLKINLDKKQELVFKAHYTVKISEVSLNEIGIFLKRIMLLLGLPERNIPSKQEEYDMLRKAVKTYLSNYTLQEIRLAVDLCLRKEIYFEFKLYDLTFNIVILTDLMDKYKEYRDLKLFEISKKQKELDAESKIDVDKKNDEILIPAIEKSYQDFLSTGKIDFDDLPILAENRYDFLVKKQLISDSIVRKNEALKKAENIIKTDLINKSESTIDLVKKKEYKDLLNAFTSEKNTKVIAYAKMILLKEYFNNCKEFELTKIFE